MLELKYLLKQLKSKKLLILAYLALIIESLIPMFTMIFQRNLIDQVFIGKVYSKFLPLLLVYLLFFFGSKLWFTIRRVLFSQVSYDLQENLVSNFLNKIYGLKGKELHNEQVGKLVNHIRSDISDACDLSMNQLLSEGLKNLLTILLLSGLLASINIVMTLLVLGVSLSYYLLVQVFGKKTKDLSSRVRKEKAGLSTRIEETITGIREVASNNRYDWQVSSYESIFKNYYKAVLKERFYKNKVILLSEPLLFITKLSAIALGGGLVMRSMISVGDFVISFSLVDQIITELGLLFNQALTGKRLVAAVKSFKAPMDRASLPNGKMVLYHVKSLQFEQVSFAYSDQGDNVLNKLTMAIEVGKNIAIVGQSGCGKSTIGKLICKSYCPDQGRVTINGIDINDYDNSYTDAITIVTQEPHFIPVSLLDNLTLGQDYSLDYITQISKMTLCHNFIMALDKGYETIIGDKGTTLSGGQKQRLALTRALLKDTDVLILDESTSALDTETEYQVLRNIEKLRKGKTTITIAHRLSAIKDADLVYLMDDGSIHDIGSHEDLMASSKYRKLLSVHEENVS
ncbi:ABC transporter ATP-binding protein [Acidaminobacter sp. JC074]|uniref:ABC transporter ATP-binding protein n=1 Tax=Acidaminobacter sp. JC074 TaxID=2530199 RepID=UPI001F0EAD5A|nr:ABC transporter ATP-binding protein [Acidaminobacter sp. JC074]MCH4886958.1 ABC transporter ATP-binding protein [Acidaminobacter sp. JC074]